MKHDKELENQKSRLTPEEQKWHDKRMELLDRVNDAISDYLNFVSPKEENPEQENPK